MKANETEIEILKGLYQGRKAYHGELHDHAATGGTSDGQRNLDHWRGAMEALHMDFAAILDHRQVRHMYEPQWEDGVFIGGSEPGTKITEITAQDPHIHYNMVFAGPEPLEELLAEFPEFEFTGGKEGHFTYPKFTRDRFLSLVDTVKAKGGFFVHSHPKQVMISDDPLDYWFGDETGIEVFYSGCKNSFTDANYQLWLDILAAGKRVWACAGGDGHACASDRALTTIYAEEKKNAAYLSHLREGDFVCGPVGIQMCIGDTRMGGQCDFAGKKLVLGISDFHVSVKNPEHRYRVDLLDDKGVVLSEEIPCTEASYFAFDPSPEAKFYRAEIFDVTADRRIAIGNPIWPGV